MLINVMRLLLLLLILLFVVVVVKANGYDSLFSIYNNLLYFHLVCFLLFCSFIYLLLFCWGVFFLISFCAAKWNLIIKILSITLKKTNGTTKSVCKNNKNYINSQWEISDNTRSQLALSQFRSFNIALFNSRSLSLLLWFWLWLLQKDIKRCHFHS